MPGAATLARAGLRPAVRVLRPDGDGRAEEKLWACITAAHEGDGPISVAALCRAVVPCLGVDGASVIATSGMVAREPLFASDELSAQLEELQFTTGEGPGAQDLEFGAPLLVPDLESATARWPILCWPR